jgi:hypothetical protein
MFCEMSKNKKKASLLLGCLLRILTIMFVPFRNVFGTLMFDRTTRYPTPEINHVSEPDRMKKIIQSLGF